MAETVGRCCLCNGLIAAIGLGQRRPDGTPEPPIVTLGQDLSFVSKLLRPGRQSYTAADVVAYLLAPEPDQRGAGADVSPAAGGGTQLLAVLSRNGEAADDEPQPAQEVPVGWGSSATGSCS